MLASVLLPAVALAADHAEAPGAASDPAADIADFYAWHADGSLYAIVTFAPLTAAGGSATYDADVLYTIHIDSNADNTPDIDVELRFGQNGAGEWGVQALNLPGADGAVEGAVESNITSGSATVYAGLRDDPFFFDLDGYLTTLSTGTISFDASNDSLAGTNITAIAVQMDATTASGGNDQVQLWATTARK